MEDIRADVRAGATSERNTIAETRSREIGGYGASHRYDAAHRYAAAQRLRGAYNRKRDLSWRFDLNSVDPGVPLPLPPGIVCPTFPGTARGDLQYQDQERARLAADARVSI